MPGGGAPKFGSLKRCRATRGVAATVAGVALHCATKLARETPLKQGIWSSHFLRRLPRVVRRTPRDTPALQGH